MSAPQIISELVAKFRDNISEYKSQHYNETEVRREFIDLFFEALGWDVFNRQNYSEAYKDVKHEASVKIKGETKNPDYAFRVGGKEKFFVEAKKPAVNISGDYNPAFQVRRYGWTAHLSLCVLTDFEEFAVYDTRVKPSINDAPSTARIMYFNFKDYESKWDEIASVFSKDAVYKGSFDRYADDNKKKKGTTEVDDDFLALMESWRESLAKNIALRNKSCQQFSGANAAKNLNEAVQKTIDRIVFLRICEDRGIEEPDQLRNVSEKNNVYGSLCDIFNLADAKYNSGLFHFQKESGRQQDESWMLSLSIDDKVLKDIIKNLYYPAPYAFSVMPADILGHVYEKFLGKVIRLTAGLNAKVEEKPEVRKAGGVYYTPTYIVDYIVKNTVGELLKDKTPAEAEAIRILDPACGSGSFLIGAYQYLLDWYLNAYSSDSKRHATGKNPKIIAGEGGTFRLTTAEKKKILLNNIYGVDIDSQAVEVTKLSLLLKVLEGESSESLGAQFKYASERALPDLDKNIKNGNSLIGTDYFDGKMGLDNGEEWERIKPFDWESEFPHVFSAGGFDAVIGNPPYGALFENNIKKYLKEGFKHSDIEYESYIIFIERCDHYLKKQGHLGYIIPSNIISNPRYMNIRRFILKDFNIRYLIDLGSNIFTDASVDTALLLLSKGFVTKNTLNSFLGNIKNLKEINYNIINQEDFSKNEKCIFNIYSSDIELNLATKIKNNKVCLKEYVEFARGIEFGYNSDYVKDNKINTTYKPIVAGRCITRYSLIFDNKFVKFDKNDTSNFKKEEIYLENKLLIRRIGKEIIATFDDNQFYNVCDVYNVRSTKINLKYLLGILNSKAMSFFLKTQFKNSKKLFPKIPLEYFKELPIPDIKTTDSRHNTMVSLVETMLELSKKANREGITASERKMLEQQIAYTDKQIDKLVYQLYELTPEEIKIVEGEGK